MEAILAILAGLVLTAVTQFAKNQGIEAKYIVVVLAAVLGAGYTAFVTYLPVELQDSIRAFITTAMSTAWLVYEFILKPKPQN